ncbi:hypothetical protein S40288_03654 [Stachybotrys chartarum IBT 40288]|nr:hypothetical protein S40288_03654 [Stachybotrys chartarum IBT 40288]
MARRLLEAASDPNGIAQYGPRGTNKYPLMLAADVGRADIVELLIAHGADVNQEPVFHMLRTPLQHAAEAGRLDSVRLLLHHGGNVNAAPPKHRGGTALQFAAIAGSCPVASELLDHGADLSALPSKIDGRWPLEGAAEHGRLDMIRFLWDVNAVAWAAGEYHDGFTERHCLRAMSLARTNGHRGCVDLIGELSGIDPSQLDEAEYGASWLAY